MERQTTDESENGRKFSESLYKVNHLKIGVAVFKQIRSDKLVLKALDVVIFYCFSSKTCENKRGKMKYIRGWGKNY